MKFESLTSLQALQHPKHKRNIFTLILFVSLAILPFLNQRVLRMAGDEKVYISQSIEMAQNNTWFHQTLAGEPSYYKGPFHYVFVRIGLYLFGDNLIAGLWMNWLLSVLIALLMYFAIESRIRNHESSFLMGLTAALNVGLFSHVFASQMEVELTFFYVLCVFALCYFVKHPKRSMGLYLFWFSAGMAGTIKSPVHSVLLGASGLLFWLWWSWSAKVISIKGFLKNKHLYFSILFGVTTCILCYLPILLTDWQAFYETYLLREQFNKDKNYRAWHYVVTPLLYFTFPLSLYVLSSFTRLLKIRITNMFKASDLTGVQIGLSMAMPTILFWSLWSYKGQNYNLPTVPVLIFLAFATYRGYINTKSLKWVGYVGLLAPVLSWVVIYRFWPLPDWWHSYEVYGYYIGLLVFGYTFAFLRKPLALGVGTTAFFVAFGLAIAPLGRRELVDMRNLIQEHMPKKIYFFDLDSNIWNEWGLMQLALHHKTGVFHLETQSDDVMQPGHFLVIKEANELEWTKNKAATLGRSIKNIYTWNRWLTKGKSPTGEIKFIKALRQHSFSELERQYFVVVF